jgi:hypothetical protein
MARAGGCSKELLCACVIGPFLSPGGLNAVPAEGLGWVCRMNHPGLLNWIDGTKLPHDGQQIWSVSATSHGDALAS